MPCYAPPFLCGTPHSPVIPISEMRKLRFRDVERLACAPRVCTVLESPEAGAKSLCPCLSISPLCLWEPESHLRSFPPATQWGCKNWRYWTRKPKAREDQLVGKARKAVPRAEPCGQQGARGGRKRWDARGRCLGSYKPCSKTCPWGWVLHPLVRCWLRHLRPLAEYLVMALDSSFLLGDSRGRFK